MLLRLFGDLSAGPAHHYRMITETVVFTMLAERGLGPQLQAVFPGGEWQTLLKCIEIYLVKCLARPTGGVYPGSQHELGGDEVGGAERGDRQECRPHTQPGRPRQQGAFLDTRHHAVSRVENNA